MGREVGKSGGRGLFGLTSIESGRTRAVMVVQVAVLALVLRYIPWMARIKSSKDARRFARDEFYFVLDMGAGMLLT